MKNNSKKEKVFLLDTMVLINFAERCVSRDLFEDFNQIDNHFEIVEEVEKEFKRKIKPIGRERYSRHKKNGTIRVVPNDSIEIDVTRMNYLINQQFGKGELFSSLYFITQKNLNFVSDEKRVHDVFKKKLKIFVSRTSDLLDILVTHKIIDKNQKKDILEELIKKGFWLKKGGNQMGKKVTSRTVASKASKILRDKRTSRGSKSVAGSALSQRERKRRK